MFTAGDVNAVLYSASHLHRITLALVQLLEFDCFHLNIIEQTHAGE